MKISIKATEPTTSIHNISPGRLAKPADDSYDVVYFRVDGGAVELKSHSYYRLSSFNPNTQYIDMGELVVKN